LNEPSPETRFASKLLQMGERLKGSLLHNVIHVGVLAHGSLNDPQQRRQVRLDQVREQIATPADNLSDQSGFLGPRHTGRICSRCHFRPPTEPFSNFGFLVAFPLPNAPRGSVLATLP
jgi:hypothetical protein